MSASCLKSKCLGMQVRRKVTCWTLEPQSLRRPAFCMSSRHWRAPSWPPARRLRRLLTHLVRTPLGRSREKLLCLLQCSLIHAVPDAGYNLPELQDWARTDLAAIDLSSLAQLPAGDARLISGIRQDHRAGGQQRSQSMDMPVARRHFHRSAPHDECCSQGVPKISLLAAINVLGLTSPRICVQLRQRD